MTLPFRKPKPDSIEMMLCDILETVRRSDARLAELLETMVAFELRLTALERRVDRIAARQCNINGDEAS